MFPRPLHRPNVPGRPEARRALLFIGTFLCLLAPFLARAADGMQDVDKPWTESHDPVALMWQRWQTGQSHPDLSTPKRFAASVLRELNVPVASQTLVFSKTSLQNPLINPQSPRSLFFNEECYVGWAQGGMMELIGIDPEKGPQFYALRYPYEGGSHPPELFTSENCFSCHEGSRTDNVRGMLVRSVYATDSGQPLFGEGSFVSSDESPLSERWGGWYVTGKHGSERHMGNAFCSEVNGKVVLDRESGANVQSLDRFFSTTPYLTNTSDIVALMVLEHQCTMHNLLLGAAKSVREAMARQHDLQKAFGEPVTDIPQGSALSIVNSQSEKVVHQMLFCGAYTFKDKGIEGSPAFQDAFRQDRVQTKDGRSLKDFQLLTRLFKYPCSYMIYSKSFDALPQQVKSAVYERLFNVLTGRDQRPEFAHLSPSERKHVFEILVETKPNLPKSWRATNL